MSTIWEYSILAIVFSQVSTYTLVSPKIYSRSVPTNGLAWPNVVQHPFRTCHGRYFSDPYFTPNVQNQEYILAQEPYSPSLDDVDYYSNYMYYVPTANRRMPYYDQALVDVPDEIQDYDEDEDASTDDDDISESQRAWWLEKNVGPNEDTDFDRFNQIEDVYVDKPPKPNKKPKQKPKESRKIVPKTKYAGIDGFGRKKDKVLVFGNFKPTPRRVEENTIYGLPKNSQYEDVDVKQLESLRESSPKASSKNRHGDVSFADWSSGNAKRDTNSAKQDENWSKRGENGPKQDENSSIQEKLVSSLASSKFSNPFSAYNEGGQINMQQPFFEDKWADYGPEEPSVFDTIKKLLALEDKIDQVSQILF